MLRGVIMNNLLKQFSGLLGTGFAAACCLGLPVILSAIGAAGLGFIVKDAYLMPIFAAFVFFTLWQLNSDCNRHADIRPFYLSAVMGLLAIIFMFLMVTSIYANTTLLYLSLSGLVAGSIWDIVNSRKQTTCETACTTDPVDPQKRKLNGAILAVASAGEFFGLYKTVDTMAPSAQKDDIKCWGANSCKVTTA